MTMTAEPTPSTSAVGAALADMSDAELQAFIGDHLGPDVPQQIWDALLDADTADRTYDALGNLMVNLAGQAEVRRAELKTLEIGDVSDTAYLAAKADYDAWKKRANHYRTLVDQRLRQARTAARRAKQSAHRKHQAGNVDRHRRLASRLAVAIHQHREMSRAADIKPEPHDTALWSLLEELTVECGGEDVTLSEAIAFGFWYARDGE